MTDKLEETKTVLGEEEDRLNTTSSSNREKSKNDALHSQEEATVQWVTDALIKKSLREGFFYDLLTQGLKEGMSFKLHGSSMRYQMAWKKCKILERYFYFLAEANPLAVDQFFELFMKTSFSDVSEVDDND